MIARNRATDFHRRTTDFVELPDHLQARAARRLAPRRSAALAAIRSLPDAYRETLMLRLVEGLSGPEIAERTGLTAGVRPREPASRHEDAARQTRADDRPPARRLSLGRLRRARCGDRQRLEALLATAIPQAAAAPPAAAARAPPLAAVACVFWLPAPPRWRQSFGGAPVVADGRMARPGWTVQTLTG